jgi:hypothetical protein
MRDLRQFQSLIAPSVLSLVLAIAVPACDGGSETSTPDATVADAAPPPPDADIAPAFRNPVTLADDDLAHQALALLGEPTVGGSENCNKCHGLTGPRLRDWGQMAKDSLTNCLTDLSVASPESAKTMLECLRLDPTDPTSPYTTERLGPLATAATLGWFKYAFMKAYPTDWETRFADFKTRVSMPQGAHPAFTQAEFDIVAEWFLRGVPKVDDIIKDEPAPPGCTDSITPELLAHIEAMKTQGWTAVDKENGMLMFGCPPDSDDPEACLTTSPQAGDAMYSVGWTDPLPGQTMRILRDNPYHSSYWTRSSADGRFVGHGARSTTANAFIVDLKEDRAIPLSADYDPGFFPDNQGFMFQSRDNAFACDLSVLTSSPTKITFNEPGCTTISQNQVGLYQYIGTAPGNGDYWTVAGNFNSDNGAQSQATHNEPFADFGSGESVSLTAMVHTGTTFTPENTLDYNVPYEGDFSMSPSSQLIVSRLGTGTSDRNMKAFVIHQVKATPNPAGGYTAEIPEVARFCMRGAKPSFSLDERWMILHHYVGDDAAVNLGFTGPDDPGFAPYKASGAANVFLVDMKTGARTRITNMKPGQYALYPHFRADGWIYFIVRTLGTPHEYIVASDAALVLAQQQP